MASLELKVPPPFVAGLLAAAMWWVAPVASRSDRPWIADVAAVVMVVLGTGFSAAGLHAFRRAKTTINPLLPAAASALVVAGVYRISRNPMYLGLTLVLLAWAAFLWSPWGFVGPFAFVTYISRFQIAPEERALAAQFGSEWRPTSGASARGCDDGSGEQRSGAVTSR